MARRPYFPVQECFQDTPECYGVITDKLADIDTGRYQKPDVSFLIVCRGVSNCITKTCTATVTASTKHEQCT
jgi:hypothetical protein